MRTIDADHLKSMLQEYIKREQAYIDIGNNTSIAIGHSNGLWEAIAQIDEEPTIEVPQRMRGRWVLVKGSNGKDYHKCSKCLHTQDITGVKNYCAVCGAEMEGAE